MTLRKGALALLLAAPVLGSDGGRLSPLGLTVHEWGTFTSVAGEAGGAAAWNPLGGPSDLPCFVAHLHGRSYKSPLPSPATGLPTEKVTVRMETPVLYFYAPRAMPVSVSVDFPQGLITEWYPQAKQVTPEPGLNLPPVRNGHAEWNVEVTPEAAAPFPQGRGPSHYYAARATDADPVRVGGESEKLIFYRGIANFEVPLEARLSGEQIELRNTGAAPVEWAMVFENRGGKLGYRVARGLNGSVQLEQPRLDGDLGALRQQMAAELARLGLFAKEADAMIATWNDSWFEEGLRVFYMVTRQTVDRVLPLTVQPAPRATQRVFVGRVEMLAPFQRAALETALATDDAKALDRFGRFLEPFLAQVKTGSGPLVSAHLAAKAAAAQREFFTPSCVQ